jgi:hypothetical protein
VYCKIWTSKYGRKATDFFVGKRFKKCIDNITPPLGGEGVGIELPDMGRKCGRNLTDFFVGKRFKKCIDNITP